MFSKHASSFIQLLLEGCPVFNFSSCLQSPTQRLTQGTYAQSTRGVAMNGIGLDVILYIDLNSALSLERWGNEGWEGKSHLPKVAAGNRHLTEDRIWDSLTPAVALGGPCTMIWPPEESSPSLPCLNLLDHAVHRPARRGKCLHYKNHTKEIMDGKIITL